MSRCKIGASLAALVAVAALALAVAVPARASASVGFSFHAANITGISTGSAFLTGGGAFDPAGANVHAGGGFRCTNTIAQAPFAGFVAGQGVRWDTSELLPSTMFKCTAAEAPRAISTDAHTVVLAADFYRAGDGNDESFTAPMIVSTSDLDRDLPGDQHVWIQGIGCGLASVSFGSVSATGGGCGMTIAPSAGSVGRSVAARTRAVTSPSSAMKGSERHAHSRR